MLLKPLTLNDIYTMTEWRNSDISGYRTAYLLSEGMQKDFYDMVINSRTAPHRYFGIWEDGFKAVGGLTNIQWENRNAEISLVVNPEYKRQGYGRRSLMRMLDEGFKRMNLDNIYGECYLNNEAKDFWRVMVKELNGYATMLPNRKFWEGIYWNSVYFNFTKGCV